ncbi:MAG: HPr family phosphocarrier protein, partial [Spirochaetaceae bacterium]|nr:HPr family phosphocarrier protein [Spirochaetaceae bacterium]
INSGNITINSKDDGIKGKDSVTINAKSIMGVITMAACYQTVLTVRATGSDEEAAVAAIQALFENKFEED